MYSHRFCISGWWIPFSKFLNKSISMIFRVLVSIHFCLNSQTSSKRNRNAEGCWGIPLIENTKFQSFKDSGLQSFISEVSSFIFQRFKDSKIIQSFLKISIPYYQFPFHAFQKILVPYSRFALHIKRNAGIAFSNIFNILYFQKIEVSTNNIFYMI